MSAVSKIAIFAAGTLFGSAGFKALSTKEAKKVFVHTAAAGLKIKDYAMERVTALQENVGDIMAEAKELNDEKTALEKALLEEETISDEEEAEEAVCEDKEA